MFSIVQFEMQVTTVLSIVQIGIIDHALEIVFSSGLSFYLFHFADVNDD